LFLYAEIQYTVVWDFEGHREQHEIISKVYLEILDSMLKWILFRNGTWSTQALV